MPHDFYIDLVVKMYILSMLEILRIETLLSTLCLIMVAICKGIDSILGTFDVDVPKMVAAT